MTDENITGLIFLIAGLTQLVLLFFAVTSSKHKISYELVMSAVTCIAFLIFGTISILK